MNSARSLTIFASRWTHLSHAIHDVQVAVAEMGDASIELEKLHDQLLGIGERLAILASEDSWDGLRWLEINPRSLRLHLTPLDVSSKLNGLIDNGLPILDIYVGDAGGRRGFFAFRSAHGPCRRRRTDVPESVPHRREWADLPAARISRNRRTPDTPMRCSRSSRRCSI